MVEKIQVDLQLDREAESPLYWQVYQHLRRLILDGTLPPGTRLPATRELAVRNDIGRVTAVQAYEQLQAEGLVESRTGAGTFVSTAIASAPPATVAGQFRPRLTPWAERVLQVANHDARQHGRLDIDFGFGRSFPHIFPYDIWRRLLARYLSTDDIMLSRYGSPAGFWPLRQAIADHLARLRGVRCVPEQVVIVSGAQQALDILARLLLSPGDDVVVETPGYKDAFTLFQLHGARLQAVPVDDEGLPVEQIPTPARLVFVTPSHQFPKGGTLPLHRRLALLAWARDQGAMIVEDDYDGELRYESHPLAALQSLDAGGHVVYLGTFSKVLFPALRLGYVVLPPSLVRAFTRAKALVDRGAPTLTQAAIADFIGEGHFERHLRRLREAYAQRRETLVEALAQHLGNQVQYSNVPAGLHVMLYLPEGCIEEEVVARAAAAGVGVYSGRPYHLQQPVPPSVLLGFSGLHEEEIREGVRRLALVLCP